MSARDGISKSSRSDRSMLLQIEDTVLSFGAMDELRAVGGLEEVQKSFIRVPRGW
jgi:hypothetical protein